MRPYQLILLFICFCIVNLYAINIDKRVLGTDSIEKLRIIYNLSHHQHFALNDMRSGEHARYSTNYREPIPIGLSALSVKVFSQQNPSAISFEVFTKSKNIKYVKYPNLIFLSLLLACTYWIFVYLPPLYVSTNYRLLGFVLCMSMMMWFPVFGEVNTVNTTLHSASLMLLIICLLVSYFKQPNNLKVVILGGVFGALCLSMAAFFYSGIAWVILVIIYQWRKHYSVKPTIVAILSALMIISPWMIRNKLEVDQFTISGRGPETFVDRTYEEIWNDKNAIGLFYAYGPDFLRPLLTKLTGYSYKDRLRGGRLQHSTRAHIVDLKARKLKDESMAINSHFKAGIWMSGIKDSLYKKLNDPVATHNIASNAYKRYAIDEMVTKPLRHLKFTVIFMWRGLWVMNSIDGRSYYEMGVAKQRPLLKEILPLFGFISLLFLFIRSFLKENNQFLLLTSFPLSLFFFQSFFSHNLPRYSLQLVPCYILCLLFMVYLAMDKLLKERKKQPHS